MEKSKVILYSLMATITYLIFAEALSIGLFLSHSSEPTQIQSDRDNLLLYGILTLGCIFLYKWVKKSFGPLGSGVNILVWVLVSIVTGVSLVLVQYPLSNLYKMLVGIDYSLNYHFLGYQGYSISYLVSVGILAPIVEETFFRGFLYSRLRGKISIVKSLSVSSLLFGFVHLPYRCIWIECDSINFYSFILAFIAGFGLGLIQEKSNSLIFPIIAHITWNLIVLGLTP